MVRNEHKPKFHYRVHMVRQGSLISAKRIQSELSHLILRKKHMESIIHKYNEQLGLPIGLLRYPTKPSQACSSLRPLLCESIVVTY